MEWITQTPTREEIGQFLDQSTNHTGQSHTFEKKMVKIVLDPCCH